LGWGGVFVGEKGLGRVMERRRGKKWHFETLIHLLKCKITRNKVFLR
jgi:hypothetical protein